MKKENKKEEVLKRESLTNGKITRVKGMMPLFRKGGTIEEIEKELTKFYKKYGFDISNGCVLRHIKNTLREITLQRKGWWSNYRDISKDDILQVEIK